VTLSLSLSPPFTFSENGLDLRSRSLFSLLYFSRSSFFLSPFFKKTDVCVCARARVRVCARFIDRGECTVNVPTNDESRSKRACSLSLSLSLSLRFFLSLYRLSLPLSLSLSRAQHGRCFVTLWELNLRETALTSFRARARNPDERLSRENAKLASSHFLARACRCRIRVRPHRESRSSKLLEGASPTFSGLSEATKKAESLLMELT